MVVHQSQINGLIKSDPRRILTTARSRQQEKHRCRSEHPAEHPREDLRVPGAHEG
jgi:hypothetical protein